MSSPNTSRHHSPLFRRRNDLSINIDNDNSFQKADDSNSSQSRSRGRYLSPVSRSRVIQMENEIYDDVFMQNNNSLIYERLFNAMENERIQLTEKEREKKWNSRFHLDPMPSYNVMKDKHAKMYTSSNMFISPNSSQQRIQAYESVSSSRQEQVTRKISSASSTRRRNGSDHQKSTISDNGKTKAPLEQKKSLADIEAEHFFLKSKSRIQKLWSELRVPQDETDRFSRIYLSKCSNDNIAIVTEEIKRLTEQRNLILSILKNIENRELLLETLFSLVERYGDEKIFSKHLVAREVKNIAASLRLCTLEIVESIVQWRNILQAPKPFVWRSKNYLLKIQTDLDFFLMSSLVSLLPNVNPLKNPFLMPGIEFGANINSQSLDKKMQPSSPNRKRPKFDSSPYLAGSAALPPLSKLRQASPSENDPLKERILYAQKVVFSEGKGTNDSSGSQSSNSPSRGDKVVVASYEELGGREEELGETNNHYERQIEEQRLKEERKRQLEEEQRMKEEKKRQEIAEKKKEEERLRKEQKKNAVVLIIQSVIRGIKARKDLAHEYKVEAERAAVKIQTQVRKRMAKKKVDGINRENATLLVQTYYRGKTELTQFQYTKEFCSVIKSCLEGMQARRAYLEEKSHNSITENIYGEEEQPAEVEPDLSEFEKVVALCRGHLIRVAMRFELEAHKNQEAERLIQAKEEELRAEEEMRDKAMVKIQTQIRCFLAKKKCDLIAEQKKQAFLEELERERQEYEAAREERRRLKQENAIITIQESCRGYLAREKCTDELRNIKSASKIQCMVRQRLARKKAMVIKKKKEQEMEEFLKNERAQYEALLAQL